jgi:hypothetical protein
VDSESLNNLVKGLLRKDVDVPAFDFIIAEDLLRTGNNTYTEKLRAKKTLFIL